ncbi:MAG: DJ-1 family glyoxalase III [Candidatus Omnitrophota bacterium]
MKKILVPVADGFEEIETITVVDVLRRAGAEVVLAGIRPGLLTGSRKVKVMPDVLLKDVRAEDFDAIVVPGGQPGVNHLKKEPAVLDVLKAMDRAKKTVGAICAAPLVLKEAGMIQGRSLTSYPGLDRDLSAANYSEEGVVVDGNLVTSRGPGTALEFALKLAAKICGEEKAAVLRKDMVA